MFRLLARIVMAAWAAVCAASPGWAEEGTARKAQHRFGDDLYATGLDIRVTADGIGNIYAAGEAVTVDAAVRRTVHAIGRQVRIRRTVGGDVYAAGYGVEIDNAVVGDVTAAGYRIELGGDGAVGRNALLAGRLIHLRGPVAGNANLAGEDVEIDAPISGSAEIRADHIRFGPNARIDGTLAYWTRRPIEIPAGVIPAERITAHALPQGAAIAHKAGIAAAIAGGTVFTVVLLILALLFAWLLPRPLAQLRGIVRAQPWRSLLFGVIVLSALFGSLLVFAISLIGIPLLPLMLVAIPLALLAGYLGAAHMLGRSLLNAARMAGGEGSAAAIAAMLAGLAALILLGFVPVLGWLVAVLAVIFGLGAWALYLLQPRSA
ncbi:MAG TPA: hypothetical protein VF194_01225 [Ferrovibrio sp.]|uniref:hypothetical protein n=1 Tax=Ferrovibrio sp. TaxID=1917215 RepID=UPI002ED63189